MVYRIATTGAEALDLNNFADNFGKDDDVLIIADSYGYTGNIATYDGNDLIAMNNFGLGYGGPVWGGRGNDTIAGGSAADVIDGGDGNDSVDGGRGADQIYDDRGRDVLIGGAGSDMIHFTAYGANQPGQAIANTTTVICDLSLVCFQNLGVFGFDKLIGIENIYGGYGNDRFFGTNSANAIEGFLGNDLIDGRGGNDTLYSSAGSDTMTGGTGADAITLDESDSYRDVVRFVSMADSGTTAATRDVIDRFEAGFTANADRIDLSAIDARPLETSNQAFVFVTAFTSAAGEVKVEEFGNNTLVSVDTDADADAEMTFLMTNASDFSAIDFIL